MLRRNQLSECHMKGVNDLLYFQENKDRIVQDLLDDLSLERWEGSSHEIGMLHEFRFDQDRYISAALEFLNQVGSFLLDPSDSIDGLPEIYARDLLYRERLYMVAQLTRMFFQQADDTFWCVQVYQTGKIRIHHEEPSVPWNENCWILGLKHPDDAKFFSPIIARLEFMDEVRFLQNGEVLNLVYQGQKMSAVVDNTCGISHTLRLDQYTRFAPSMEWIGSLYQGFPDRTIR